MNKDRRRFCTGHISRIAIAILVAWTTIEPGFAQDAQTPPPQPPAQSQTKIYSLTDLEYLLGPIALYPDPLLTLVLTGSAFPLQIVQADRWIVDNSDAVKQNDFTKVDGMPWDSSVQALTRFPDVIQMLSDHLDWTELLGMAFSSQPEDVANVIQMLRAKAENVGNLKSTPEQVVTSREESGSRIIYIAPANPERIYVPVYDSSAVFTSALTGALIFGTGVLVGSTWNNRWGWNNRGWNQVWISPPVWQPPPPNWRPPLRPGARPPGVWRPDRPGTRPDRPGPRPDRPGAGRPDRPGAGRPDRPGAGGPDRPGVRPDRPGTGRPDRPGTGRPDRPETGRPDRPGTGRPDRPGNRPEGPGVGRPERPAARPERPTERPAVRPERPVTSRPADQRRRQAGSQQRRHAGSQQRSRPQQTHRPPQRQQGGARPQQRARPQQQARPGQHHARPRQGGGAGSNQRPQRTRPQPGATPQ